MSDTWQDDVRTNTAIELLYGRAAKTDVDGRVVPRHRYTRQSERVFRLVGMMIYAPRYQSFTLTQDRRSEKTTTTARIEVEMEDGTSWLQEGVVSSDEGFYDGDAMAISRAVLQYTDDDDEPMTPDQVPAMLERRRATDPDTQADADAAADA